MTLSGLGELSHITPRHTCCQVVAVKQLSCIDEHVKQMFIQVRSKAGWGGELLLTRHVRAFTLRLPMGVASENYEPGRTWVQALAALDHVLAHCDWVSVCLAPMPSHACHCMPLHTGENTYLFWMCRR